MAVGKPGGVFQPSSKQDMAKQNKQFRPGKGEKTQLQKQNSGIEVISQSVDHGDQDRLIHAKTRYRTRAEPRDREEVDKVLLGLLAPGVSVHGC